MPAPNNENISELIGTPYILLPTSTAAGTFTVGPVNTGGATRTMFEVLYGDISATSSKLDLKLQAATTSNGSYTDITNAAITQVTNTGSGNTGGIVQIEIKGDSLAAASQGPWVKALGTVTGANIILGGTARVATPHYAPASLLDSAKVTQKVTV